MRKLNLDSVQAQMRLLIENHNDYEFVGYHCSPNSFGEDDFFGEIEGRYVESATTANYLKPLVEIVLQSPYNKSFLNNIKEYNEWEGGENDMPLIDLGDIPSIYSDDYKIISEELLTYINENFNWIFVHRKEPEGNYGENCYKVYFKDMTEVYHLYDRIDYGADIYVYSNKNTPKVKRYS